VYRGGIFWEEECTEEAYSGNRSVPRRHIQGRGVYRGGIFWEEECTEEAYSGKRSVPRRHILGRGVYVRLAGLM
jgi:hypothetical protein